MKTNEGLEAQHLQLRPLQISAMNKIINIYQTLVTIYKNVKDLKNYKMLTLEKTKTKYRKKHLLASMTGTVPN